MRTGHKFCPNNPKWKTTGAAALGALQKVNAGSAVIEIGLIRDSASASAGERRPDLPILSGFDRCL